MNENQASPRLVLKRLAGHRPAEELHYTQRLLAPHSKALALGWAGLWWAILLCLAARTFLPPLLRRLRALGRRYSA